MISRVGDGVGCWLSRQGWGRGSGTRGANAKQRRRRRRRRLPARPPALSPTPPCHLKTNSSQLLLPPFGSFHPCNNRTNMSDHHAAERAEVTGEGGGGRAEARNDWAQQDRDYSSLVGPADRDGALARVRAQLMLVLNEVREERAMKPPSWWSRAAPPRARRSKRLDPNVTSTTNKKRTGNLTSLRARRTPSLRRNDTKSQHRSTAWSTARRWSKRSRGTRSSGRTTTPPPPPPATSPPPSPLWPPPPPPLRRRRRRLLCPLQPGLAGRPTWPPCRASSLRRTWRCGR